MLKKVLHKKSIQIYFYICLGVVEFLATTKSVHIEIVENMWDKVNHFIAFFVLYILLSLAYQNLKVIFKIILLLLFGLQIEIVQQLSGRSLFSGFDIFVDVIAIFISIVTIYFLKSIIVRIKIQ